LSIFGSIGSDISSVASFLGHLQGSTTIDGKRVPLTPEGVRKAQAERAKSAGGTKASLAVREEG
jgi:hypothetical protein